MNHAIPRVSLWPMGFIAKMEIMDLQILQRRLQTHRETLFLSELFHIQE